MSERNGRDKAPEEWLSVAEAARRLETTEPRLRRLLSRPDFSLIVRQEARQTKTGTRTARVIPVSVLPDLKASMEKGSNAPPSEEHKYERERSEALSLISIYQALAAEKDARLAQQERELQGKQREIDHLHDEVAFLKQIVEGRILPPPDEMPPPGRSEAVSERERAAGVYQDGHDGNPPITGVADQTERRKPARRWWQVWKRG